jgi:hypothetical protein
LSIDGPTAEQEAARVSAPVCVKCGRNITAKDSYFPISTGSYCVKCRKHIMRDRYQRLNQDIYPYTVIKPIPPWQVFAFFLVIGFTLAFLVIMEAIYG